VSDAASPEGLGRARERTTFAWTRTGLSFAVAGTFLVRVLGDDGALAIGSGIALVALGSVAWSWGWWVPRARPAVDTRLGRITVRVLGIGTAAVAVLAIASQLPR
jgi:uncharacterized membrane protein YidH (DUF202 family)